MWPSPLRQSGARPLSSCCILALAKAKGLMMSISSRFISIYMHEHTNIISTFLQHLQGLVCMCAAAVLSPASWFLTTTFQIASRSAVDMW